jgi:hypothetical protein
VHILVRSTGHELTRLEVLGTIAVACLVLVVILPFVQLDVDLDRSQTQQSVHSSGHSTSMWYIDDDVVLLVPNSCFPWGGSTLLEVGSGDEGALGGRAEDANVGCR